MTKVLRDQSGPSGVEPRVVNGPGGVRSTHLAYLTVLGPLALVSNTGKDITPHGRKSHGLLALLALAPRGERTRGWLRARLWSDSGEKNSATSLRQSVFELRRFLGELADEILVINRLTIGLRLDRVWIDARAITEDADMFHRLGLAANVELLEGIDINDEGFEEWLQVERQVWFEKIEACAERPAPPKAGRAEALVPLAEARAYNPVPTFSIGFLPSIKQGCDATSAQLADHILEGVATNLRELFSLAIHDFRDPASSSDLIQSTCETEYYLRVRTLQVRNGIVITIFLYRASQMRLEWSQSIQTSLDEVMENDMLYLSSIVGQTVDRVAKLVCEQQHEAPDPETRLISAGYTALNAVFQLRPDSMEKSETLLLDAERETGRPVFTAMRAYLASFKVGESFAGLDPIDLEDARELARKAEQANPFNSIALACLGHVVGYVFGQHEEATELLERALRLNRSQAFVWDHYALNKFYTGDYGVAYEAAKNAVEIGRHSPLSYSHETTLAMTATMVGDHGRAIIAARNAHRKQPRFCSAMRYLIVNYGLTGRRDEAMEVYRELLQADPDFEHVDAQRARFRLPQRDAEEVLLKGIRNARV